MFFNHLFDPVSLIRDNAVKTGLTRLGYFVEAYNAEVLFRPWEIFGPKGKPFESFKDYWEHCTTNLTPESPIPAPLVAIPAAGPPKGIL